MSTKCFNDSFCRISNALITVFVEVNSVYRARMNPKAELLVAEPCQYLTLTTAEGSNTKQNMYDSFILLADNSRHYLKEPSGTKSHGLINRHCETFTFTVQYINGCFTIKRISWKGCSGSLKDIGEDQ